jgi:hypothetical protein
MSKFPLLNLYRSLAIAFAIITLVGGVLVGLADSRGVFSFTTFLAPSLPFFVAAFALGIVAELIQLLLKMEDHLDHIRRANERNSSPSTPTESKVQSASSQLSSSSPYTYSTRQVSQRNQNPYEPTVRVSVKILTYLHTEPAASAPSSSTLSQGQTITVYGRNDDSTWLSVSRMGKFWISVIDVDIIEGHISNLPILKPSE